MMANNVMPEDWRDEPCFLVAIPRPLVPFVGGLLKMTERRGFWASEADYLRGYTAITELEACLMTACLDVLFQKQDELYRLINTAVLAVAYTALCFDPH